MLEKTPFMPPPYKSAAVALLFTVILGPVGLLYASWWGGFIMIMVGIVVVSSKLLFPILLLWIISCLFSVRAVESHNVNVFNQFNQKLRWNEDEKKNYSS
jgi:hypothetical protein